MMMAKLFMLIEINIDLNKASGNTKLNY